MSENKPHGFGTFEGNTNIQSPKTPPNPQSTDHNNPKDKMSGLPGKGEYAPKANPGADA